VPGHFVLAMWPRLIADVFAPQGNEPQSIERLSHPTITSELPVGSRLRARAVLMDVDRGPENIVRYRLDITIEREDLHSPVAHAIASTTVRSQ